MAVLMHGAPALANLKPLVEAIDEFELKCKANDFDEM